MLSKKNILISIRIGEEEKEMIKVLRRYDENFNASNFFRESLSEKLKATKKEMGAEEVGFPMEKQTKETKVPKPGN